MWITRDEAGTVELWDIKPIRANKFWILNDSHNSSALCTLNDEAFSNLKWEDEPIEVKIVSKLISEDKLNKIAEEYAKNAENENYKIDWQLEYSDINDAFKAGYRKAKEE